MRHLAAVSPPVRGSCGEATTTTPTTDPTATPTIPVQEPRVRSSLRGWCRRAGGGRPLPSAGEGGVAGLGSCSPADGRAGAAGRHGGGGFGPVADRRGAAAAVAWRHSVAEVGMILGTAPWLWMILTPRDAPGEVHLLPLRDLAAQLAGDPGAALAQIGGTCWYSPRSGRWRRCGSGRWPACRSSSAWQRLVRWRWRQCSTCWRWVGCPRSTTCCSTPPVLVWRVW
jgi:hypothetical protein